MFEVIFLICLGIVWIVFAMIQDLKTREIANWLSLSLIVFALVFRFFWSLFSSPSNFEFFYHGLMGFGIFFVLGIGFYYLKVFAGGDAKLMIALGTVLPFYSNIYENLNLFFVFILLFLFVGTLYGIISSMVLAFKNRKSFNKKFRELFKKNKKKVFLALVVGILISFLSYFDFILLFLGLFVVLIPYLYLWAKAVDESCMIKKVSPNRLTEGDWLYKDIRVGKNLIKATWDGLSAEEIILLKKNKKDVLVRYGIEFTPVFLISFLFLVLFFFRGLV
jgi:Flp pilus assembly protein protease CpaA